MGLQKALERSMAEFVALSTDLKNFRLLAEKKLRLFAATKYKAVFQAGLSKGLRNSLDPQGKRVFQLPEAVKEK